MRPLFLIVQAGLLVGCQASSSRLELGLSSPVAVGEPCALGLQDIAGVTSWSVDCGADCSVARDARGTPLTVTPGHEGTYTVRVSFTDAEGAPQQQAYDLTARPVARIVLAAEDDDASATWPESAPLALGLALSRTALAYTADGTTLHNRPRMTYVGVEPSPTGPMVVAGEGSITASLGGISETLRVHGVAVPPDGPFELHRWQDGVMDPVALPRTFESGPQAEASTYLLTTAPDARGNRTLVPAAYVTVLAGGTYGIQPWWPDDPTIRIQCTDPGTTRLVAATATVLSFRCTP